MILGDLGLMDLLLDSGYKRDDSKVIESCDEAIVINQLKCTLSISS